MNIAIQGEAGSFHEAAAREFFPHATRDIVCCTSFSEVFNRVERRDAEVGVVAAENSLYGSLHETYDLLVKHDFMVVGEVTLHIHHQLITHPNATLSDITEVYSQSPALDQCRTYLETTLPKAKLVEYYDTVGAVMFVKDSGRRDLAAIASKEAAALHNMTILAKNIEDEPTNFTRFLIIAPTAKPLQQTNKASLILTTSHAPGSLYEALGVFAKHTANLTKLESRPLRGQAFMYQFIIDVETDAETLSSIVSELIRGGCSVKVLGRYNAA